MNELIMKQNKSLLYAYNMMDMLQLILWRILFLELIAATAGGQNKE